MDEMKRNEYFLQPLFLRKVFQKNRYSFHFRKSFNARKDFLICFLQWILFFAAVTSPPTQHQLQMFSYCNSLFSFPFLLKSVRNKTKRWKSNKIWRCFGKLFFSLNLFCFLFWRMEKKTKRISFFLMPMKVVFLI